LKNLGLVGAALLAAVDTAGQPGLAWRAGHLAQDTRRNFQSLGKGANKTVGQTAKTVGRTARTVSETAAKAASKTTAAVAGS
jgi:hypothetical protein